MDETTRYHCPADWDRERSYYESSRAGRKPCGCYFNNHKQHPRAPTRHART